MQWSFHRRGKRSRAICDQTEPTSRSRGQDKQTEPTGVYGRGLPLGEVEPRGGGVGGVRGLRVFDLEALRREAPVGGKSLAMVIEICQSLVS